MAIQSLIAAVLIGVGVGFVLYNLLQANNVMQINSILPHHPIDRPKPTKKRRRRRSKDEQKLECLFCAEPFNNGSKKTLGCGHVFHAPCITRWLAGKKNRCPFRCH